MWTGLYCQHTNSHNIASYFGSKLKLTIQESDPQQQVWKIFITYVISKYGNIYITYLINKYGKIYITYLTKSMERFITYYQHLKTRSTRGGWSRDVRAACQATA